jgi:hypothetical protein
MLFVRRGCSGILIHSGIANGKFAEEWAETDFLGMLQQLGAIPAMG